MDVQVGTGVVAVRLSRRNLVDLLVAVDSRPENAVLVRQVGDVRLFVGAETDEMHYRERKVAGPGINYPGMKEFKEEGKDAMGG